MINKIGINKIILLVLCISVMLIGVGMNTFKDQQGNHEDNRLEDLIQWGHELVDSPLTIVVKWQGEWRTNGKKSPIEAAQELASNIRVSMPELVSNTEYITYRSNTDIEGINVIFNWQVITEDRGYMMVTLECSDSTNEKSLISLHEKIKTHLSNLDVEWNASVQGSVDGELSTEEIMKEVEAQLHRNIDFNKVESYKDDMTISHSYRAPTLGFNLVSGENYIDFQTAVHRDEMLGINRITIGFPVITIEF
ncbi:YwmB family TATA-box binding protein [Paenibacillus crassostreae]|uniref:TATA-box binding protein n=1 Tax=Paenibacillus crassostreae TaxID=1763538 RepID=A0A167CSU5_9BACL|nr:YwmB family TATA-box binding protein [Paenibacillus crassostreae]AOZ93518.1 hypothetical protein LPB68_15860 [Paenibacillus crassostreae]OAB73540.1 hypothetical protein PNBC_13595 [Paenibacillus crassostreae]